MEFDSFFMLFSGSLHQSCSTGSMYRIWTDGQRIDVTSESPFVWKLDGNVSIPMNYTNWDVGQPDYSFVDESCLELHTVLLQWNDDTCDSKKCMLCEIDMAWKVA